MEVEFADGERALQQVSEWAERGTWQPVAVFGLEGCGKTAWLRRAAEILRESGYEVFYIHPLDKHAAWQSPLHREAVKRALEKRATQRLRSPPERRLALSCTRRPKV